MPRGIGGEWGDEQLLRTVIYYGGAGDDANQEAQVRFLRGVARLVKKRLNRQSETDQSPSVFLLLPSPPDVLEATDLEFQPMLDDGEKPVGGRLWFVGPVVLSGRSTMLSCESDAEIFGMVIDKLEAGSVPAVIYNPRTSPPTVRYYPSGLVEADRCEVVSITSGSINLDSVLAVVDLVHARQLVTPDAQSQMGKLWQNRARGRPVEKAELTIQMYLETALNSAFPTCTIRSEQHQVSGRLDIEVEEVDPDRPEHFVRHALLELKVLKSYSSTGTPVPARRMSTWIREGVEQAYAYRVDRGTLKSALCCFDMRQEYTGEKSFARVRREAGRLDVTLRIWHLFASSRAYRAHVSANRLR